MATGLASLVATGTRLWLDSVDPDLVRQARAAGAAELRVIRRSSPTS